MKQQTPRRKADELRKSGRFEEAAKEYAALWPDGDRWTGWGYAFCLRKLGRSSEALEVASCVDALDPAFAFGRSIYAWCLYDVHIRGAENTNPDMLRAAETIVRLAESDGQAYAPTSPFVPTVLHVAKAWATRRRDVYALMWLDKLDPSQLQTQTFTWKDENGRVQHLASHRERYYGIRTHALERLGRWQECLDTATRALIDCGQLHYDNDVWFARRIARAKVKLGRAHEALAELQQLVARKPTAFMQTDIAVAAWEAGNLEATFRHALQAVVTTRDIGFVLRAVHLLGEVLWRRDEKDHARKHVRLCIAVRSSRGWRPSEELTKLAAAWDANGPEEVVDALLSELRALWKLWDKEVTGRRTGTILRMLPHGHAGFIRAQDGEHFYFDSRDWREPRWQPAQGAKVTFATRPGFDRKRQRPTIVACDVHAASPP